MAEKKYPIWTSKNGNHIENNVINMNDSAINMSSFSIKGENVFRNNITDLVNSKINQTAYVFSCRNLMSGNKFKLKNSTIEQNCVIIFKNGFGKRPFRTSFKRTIRGY